MNRININQTSQLFQFRFPGPGPIYLVGEFNNWTRAEEFKMHQAGSNQWEILTQLSEGEFRYGFEVRGCVFEDPEAPLLPRSLGWPRSCVQCPARFTCLAIGDGLE